MKHFRDEEKKLHFMHIPKTAGTTFYNIVDSFFDFSEICPSHFLYHLTSWKADYRPFSYFSIEQIKQFKLFRGHLGWIPRLFFSKDQIDTVTFLRDPIERCLSNIDFNMRKTDPLSKIWGTLDAFLWDPIYGDFYKANIQTRFFCADLYFKMDFSYETPHPLSERFLHLPFGYHREIPDKQLLQLAIERLHACVFVGVVETFNPSFEGFCKQYFGWVPDVVPRLNFNAAPNRTRYADLSSQAKDRLFELNQLDIILYNEALKLVRDRHTVRVSFDLPSHPFLSSEINFNFAQKYFGENWHAREKHLNDVFCWSSQKTAKCFFPFKIKKNMDLSVRFYVKQFLLPIHKTQLNLTINGYPIVLQYEALTEGYIFFGKIASQLFHKNNTLQLVFSLPEIMRPIDIDPASKDDRYLGFACQWVKIKAIEKERKNRIKNIFLMFIQYLNNRILTWKKKNGL